MTNRNQLSFVQRSLINPPTYIEYKGARFLIVDAPSNNNLPLYIKEFERWNVTDVVRCCEPTYAKEPLEGKGIKVHDWVYGDGEAPPNSIVDAWLALIEKRFGGEIGNHEANEKTGEGQTKKPPCIATHCVAGLGRAPVLVAIALIEEGMSPLDSVAYIRERRRGAINNKQLKYIESYKRRSKGKSLWLSLTYVSAQVTSAAGNFNVTNPVENQTYVTGQQLPITWRLLANTNFASLQLEIVLSNNISGNLSETILTTQADVSASNQQTANNQTFYEHSINYPIPANAPLGNYNVIFIPQDTNVNTTIPIKIIAAASTSSSMAPTSSSGAASGSNAMPSNPFASSADKVVAAPIHMAGFTLAALGVVAAIAF
ncbi:unnamed protein product [Umbelopsis vinacea]